MKIKPQQLKKLAPQVLMKLDEKQMLTYHVPNAKVLAAIEKILLDDWEKEQEIDRLVKKTMDQVRAQNQDDQFDYQKMYGMVKRQIIKDKGFTP